MAQGTRIQILPKLINCEMCGKEGPESRHPCRFERACSCWRGKACK